tara:strand:+ start:835 stop:1272 length:438 start_codon:yes stop_codon:yes gene_type:complete
MNILVVNGPNLNLLGIREPNIYGVDTLSDIENWINNELKVRNITLQWYQSNHEGKIVDRLHRAMHDKNDGIIINPGAYTHYSYAIRDAIAAISIPTIEVHLSDIKSRENFRQLSVIQDVCLEQISGLGKNGYLEAINVLEKYFNK